MVIPIERLVLSDDNPRLSIYDDTQDILREMVENQKDKLFVLAEDILYFGLSPIDSWAAYPTGNNMYKIAEGNRRLSAIIILNEPTIIKDIDPRIYRRFVDLRASTANIPPKEIECVVFESWEDPKLQHWIQIRHLGLNKGRGIDGWDSVQKSRYEQRMYGVNALIDFWERLVELNILSFHEIRSVSKTNWERLLLKKGRDFLGLEKQQSNYKLPDDLRLFTLKIRTVIEKLKNRTVGIVYDNEKIQVFLDEVNQELFGVATYQYDEEETVVSSDGNSTQLDFNDRILSDDSEEIGRIVNSDRNEPNQNNNIDTTEEAAITPSSIFSNCISIIPMSHSIGSRNHRMSSIIDELKKLNVEKYPNACGLLLRVLFELAAKHYLENKSNGGLLEEMKFEKLLKDARESLYNENKITLSQKAQLKADSEVLNQMFNGFAHNTDTIPTPATLKNLFKAHQTFITECLK